MSTPIQIRAIHALRRQVPGFDEEDTYRSFLEGQAGVRSSKDLSEDQARRVVTALAAMAHGHTPKAEPRETNPRSGLVRRILREAFAAGWDLPTEAGRFDNSVEAKRARVRLRVQSWLQERFPHLHGTPRRLEGWPVEALQALIEHLKGVAGAKRRWQTRR